MNIIVEIKILKLFELNYKSQMVKVFILYNFGLATSSTEAMNPLMY